MESTRCNKNAILHKKSEIKSIIDNFRELTEIYGSNYDEKTVNTLKKLLKKEEDIFCDEEDDSIEDLKICIEFVKFVKNRYFGEYQSKRHNNLISSTFIESPDWIKNKKCTINPQNKGNKCFQYSIIISLYHKEIKNNPDIISKIKPFINNLNWENINFPPEEEDFKTFEMNNKSVALNVLHTHSDEKISHFYKSEFNKTR